MSNAYQVVRDFEKAVGEYTGAPYVVTTNSCSMALLLAVAWNLRHERDTLTRLQMTGRATLNGNRWRPSIEIPSRTYVSVPMAIIHAGGRPTFRDDNWRGSYQLKPLPVWDSARWFTSNMYHQITAPDSFDQPAGGFVCVSFHASKTLGDSQGGALLHDDPEADAWLRRARFDGRMEGVAPKDDTFSQVGWHGYMSNDVAARLLLKLNSLPRHNEPLANDDYPDLSTFKIFT